MDFSIVEINSTSVKNEVDFDLIVPSLFFYIIMGIVQGILEWIPVSSEGQLIFISTTFFSLSIDTAIRLAIWLHFGTLFAVLIFYRNDWKKVLNETQDDENLRSLLFYATIGTALISLPIRLAFSGFLKPVVGAIFLLIMAIALFFTSAMLKVSQADNFHSLKELTKSEQFLVGMFQGLAIIPGISRSGTTIGALLMMKVDKDSSLKGSFLISVPAVLGAVGLEILLAILGDNDILSSLRYTGILVAIVLSFLFGILTLHVLINLVQKVNFSILTAITGLIFLIGFIVEVL